MLREFLHLPYVVQVWTRRFNESVIVLSLNKKTLCLVDFAEQNTPTRVQYMGGNTLYTLTSSKSERIHTSQPFQLFQTHELRTSPNISHPKNINTTV